MNLIFTQIFVFNFTQNISKMQAKLYSEDDFKCLLQRPFVEILKFMIEIGRHNRKYPDETILIPYTSIPTDVISKKIRSELENSKLIYIMNGVRNLSGACRNFKLMSLDIIKEIMDNQYPYLKNLSYENYVIAGSAAALLCGKIDNTICYQPGDIDIFMYSDNNKNQSYEDQTYKDKYVKCLKDIEKVLIDAKYDISIGRHSNCTNFVGNNEDGPNIDIQIIHKVHSSRQSILAKFDISPSKALYDGKMFYFTLDGALAHYFGINVIDYQIDTPAFLQRIYKYCYTYNYSMIIPNLHTIDFINVRGNSSEYTTDKFITNTHRYKIVRYDGTNSDTPKIDFQFTPTVNDNENYHIKFNISKYSTECYGMIAMGFILAGRYDLVAVFANNTRDLINNFQTVNFKECLLNDVINSKYSETIDKFVGSKYSELLRNCRLICEKFPISQTNMELLKAYQIGMESILTERTQFFEEIVKPIYENLKTIKPTNFNVKNRKLSSDLWGPKARPFKTTFCYEQKFMLLLCFKRLKNERQFPYIYFDKGLIQLILKAIDVQQILTYLQ